MLAGPLGSNCAATRWYILEAELSIASISVTCLGPSLKFLEVELYQLIDITS